ncbi:MAG: acylphosphatase [Planctomycetia bacterium]|nr:acylphosphatase [Planctomycetia bacterium]
MSATAPICREVFYRGRVQGVGFRYTAREVAQRHAVVGFVQNLPDGRVHLVVEGGPEVVDAFLSELCRVMGRYIRDTSVSDSPAAGGFDGFDIRRY